MNRPLTRAESLAISAAMPHYTNKEKLEIFAGAYAAMHSSAIFVTTNEMEHIPLEVFCTMSTLGTPFEPGIKALNEAGVPTEQTFGDLMRATGANQEDLHDIACACHYGDTIDASRIAFNAFCIADGARPPH